MNPTPTPNAPQHPGKVDVYSYGVLLAECLTSERPYAGGYVGEI